MSFRHGPSGRNRNRKPTKRGSQMSQKLKELRQEARISQILLSRTSGVSRYKLSLVENGFGELSARQMQKIQEALERLVNEGYMKIKSKLGMSKKEKTND